MKLLKEEIDAENRKTFGLYNLIWFGLFSSLSFPLICRFFAYASKMLYLYVCWCVCEQCVFYVQLFKKIEWVCKPQIKPQNSQHMCACLFSVGRPINFMLLRDFEFYYSNWFSTYQPALFPYNTLHQMSKAHSISPQYRFVSFRFISFSFFFCLDLTVVMF